jgi:hypothetical protein
MYEVDVSHGSELPAGRRLNEKIRRFICNYQRSAINPGSKPVLYGKT